MLLTKSYVVVVWCLICGAVCTCSITPKWSPPMRDHGIKRLPTEYTVYSICETTLNVWRKCALCCKAHKRTDYSLSQNHKFVTPRGFIPSLHQNPFTLCLYAQTKLGTQRRSWVAFPPLHQRARKTDRVIVNKMLLDSFCCIKLSFLWYYGQPGSKIISDLNAHPLQAGKTTLPLRSVEKKPALVIQWAKTCPAQSAPSPPRPLLALSFSCCLVHTHILLSRKRSSLSEPFSPVLLLHPSPMYTWLPFLRGIRQNETPDISDAFRKMAKRKKKATKNLSSNFEPLVRFTFKNRNLDLPCLVETVFFPRYHHQHRWAWLEPRHSCLREMWCTSPSKSWKKLPLTRRSGKVSGSPRITSFSSTSLWHIAVENQESPQILVLSLSPMFICSSPTNPTSNDLYKDDFSHCFTPSESLSLSADLAKQGGAINTINTWSYEGSLFPATTVASSHVKHAREHAKLLRWW